MPKQFDGQAIPEGTLEYDSNNSGDSWWLEDKDWRALEAAGWTVDWALTSEYKQGMVDSTGRWLGALATEAKKNFINPQSGVDEFAKITGQDPTDEGCNCCGPPHSFTWRGPDGETKYMNLHRGPASISFS